MRRPWELNAGGWPGTQTQGQLEAGDQGPWRSSVLCRGLAAFTQIQAFRGVRITDPFYRCANTSRERLCELLVKCTVKVQPGSWQD